MSESKVKFTFVKLFLKNIPFIKKPAIEEEKIINSKIKLLSFSVFSTNIKVNNIGKENCAIIKGFEIVDKINSANKPIAFRLFDL